MAIVERVRYRRGAVPRFASSSCLVAALLLASPAGAVPEKVTRTFQAGVDAYRLGKYDEARGHLEKAAALEPKLPGPHRFLAAVAKAQQRWADCVTEARRALELNPASAEAPETRKLHADCRASDGRLSFPVADDGAAIAVATTAGGSPLGAATIKVDGLRFGGTPLDPRSIKPGAHALDLERQGYKPARVAIDALPGIVTDVIVELEPVEAAAKPSAPDSKPAESKPAAPKHTESKPR